MGEGGGIVGGRWRVRVVENGGIFELEETEVKAFGEQGRHFCFENMREKKEQGERVCLCVPYINFYHCVCSVSSHSPIIHTHMLQFIKINTTNIFFSIFFSPLNTILVTLY